MPSCATSCPYSAILLYLGLLLISNCANALLAKEAAEDERLEEMILTDRLT
jgi:hypothetical protein